MISVIIIPRRGACLRRERSRSQQVARHPDTPPPDLGGFGGLAELVRLPEGGGW